MRPLKPFASLPALLLAASACGGGDTVTRPQNAAPVASFDLPSCVAGQACAFVSTSTDDAGVAAWSWDFDGDGTPDAATASASFTYATAGSYDVSLTVHDGEGLSGTKTSTIEVAEAPAGNTPPTASFSFGCTDL